MSFLENLLLYKEAKDRLTEELENAVKQGDREKVFRILSKVTNGKAKNTLEAFKKGDVDLNEVYNYYLAKVRPNIAKANYSNMNLSKNMKNKASKNKLKNHFTRMIEAKKAKGLEEYERRARSQTIPFPGRESKTNTHYEVENPTPVSETLKKEPEAPRTEEPKTSSAKTTGTATEPAIKTESFFKKHWGKIGLGAGALGLVGYGAYKYKQNENNSQ